MPQRHPDKPVNERWRPLLVSLHNEPETRPVCQRRIRHKRGKHIKGQIEPLTLLRIDGQANVVTLGLQAQLAHPRYQLMHHPAPLRPAIAGVQRR
jgi:hypothetical protein